LCEDQIIIELKENEIGDNQE